MIYRAASVLFLTARIATAQTVPPASPPAPASTQVTSTQPEPERGFPIAPLIGGAAGGLGLAIALVQPKTGIVGSGSDGGTSVLAGLAGVALGALVSVTAGSEHPGRLRATAGSSTTHRWEYALAYRTPIGHGLAIEGVALVANDWWEQTEMQRRCGILGCITADYLVDARYEQMASLLVRVAYEPLPDSRFVPTVAIGAGPSRIHVENMNAPSETRTGVLLDATLGVEPGGFTAELGFRVGTMDTKTPRETAGYFRLGYTWGEP